MADQNLIHSFDDGIGSSESSVRSFVILIVIALLVGGGVGLVISKLKGGSSMGSGSNGSVAKVAGIADKKTFKDQAEGLLKEGGMDGEGSYHLERPGGATRNVYLTSSTVDLSLYVNKKVRVWGETFAAQKAGWLMDVGLVELLQ